MWPVYFHRSLAIAFLAVATASAVIPNLVWSGWPGPYRGVAATPAEACGEPATNWGTATVNGLRGELHAVSRELDTSGAATPAAADRLMAEIQLTNESTAAITLGANAKIAIVTCDGDVLSPNAGGAVDPEALDLEPGTSLDLRLTFTVPAGTELDRIVIRIQPDRACFAQIAFPLTVRTAVVVTPTAPAARSSPVPEVMRPCEGGSATSGAATSGRSGAETSGMPAVTTGGHGCDGGDATGGDATGGHGGDGGEATGGDATGGDGGDGGDATGGNATGGDGGAGGDATGGDGGDATGGDAIAGSGAESVRGADCTPAADA